MDTNAIQVGDKLTAITDRRLELADFTINIWEAGDRLRVTGIVEHDNHREFLIRVNNELSDWENVPAAIMPELFITS